MFKYTYNNKRYHTMDYYNKTTYKTKVGRVAINGGFTCPNIDGINVKLNFNNFACLTFGTFLNFIF